jgi:cyclohexadieny/prephenate dehydrogenase
VVSEPSPHYRRIALIGLGLIGSSIAWATKRWGLADAVVGHARTQATRDKAMELGFLDAVYADPADAVVDADLVVLCSPVGTFGALARAIAPNLDEGATVSDVGSVKEAVLRDVGPHLPPHVHLVPAHPVAGTEYSGPESGFAELFQNRWCILTPPEGTDPEAVERLAAFWRACGSNVEVMAATHHDLVLAITSHVPHLIAYNIVSVAAELATVTQSEVMKFSAGGFRDFTRIASSDPVMWRDIFLNNRDAVLEMLGRFSEDLTALQKAVRWGDGDYLIDVFTRGRQIRRGVIEAGQETSEPNFGRRNHERKA